MAIKDKNMHKLWLGLWIIAALSVNTVLADYKSMSEGHALFKQCTGCHGQAGERQALGKSLVINQMTKEQIVMSIEGYLDGTYGRNMKALMKGQVARLTKDQIENIAAYVASLNNNKLKSLVVPPEPKNLSPVRKAQKYLPDSMKMKLKSKRYAKDITHVKALVVHDSKTAEEAKKRGVKQYYLTKMVFQEDNKTVLELKCTPYIAKNALVKFKYQSYGGQKLSLEVYNNFKKHAQKSVVIKDNPNTRSVSQSNSSVKERVVTALNHQDVSSSLGGVTLLPSDNIQIMGPEIASNGGSVPIDIRSAIKAKRVILFAMQEHQKSEKIAEWILHERALVDFSIRIKLVDYSYMPGSTITAVVEGVDGQFYMTSIQIVVAIGGGEA